MSIVDIQEQLEDIFTNHPQAYYNEQKEPVIPADCLVQIFDAFEEHYQGVRLLDDEETDKFQDLLSKNPGLECTPAILVQFIAQKTRHSPPRSPSSQEEYDRGRSSDRDESSGDDSGTRSRHSSLGPPQTPMSAKSPFDSERRQRTGPLANKPPSSWTTKRPAPHRRKSDAGSRSDSESFSASPGVFGRTPSRSRAPSNPTSPSMSPNTNSFSPMTSPVFGRPPSRPHSRASSQQGHYSSFMLDDDEDQTIEPKSLFDYHGHRTDDSFLKSTLPMPRADDDDEEDALAESARGRVMDRPTASSTTSIEPYTQLDVYRKANEDLSRKLSDAGKMMQNKLLAHESELEEMQGRLEEMRTELNATKREEKELRAKERQNLTQIGALELEIAKATKALEHARSTYTSLQRQYQEQCAVSERYRDELRQREEVIRSMRDSASLHGIETSKWAKEHESWEVRFAQLEDELVIAQQAHVQLDEQKQENMLLKETIDRMRFDMDEMRNNAVVATSGSGQSSAANTLSKSLGAELMGKMKGGWGMDDDDEEESAVEEELREESIEMDEGDDTEGEDVIQTIITRTKRKVASRANRIGIQTRTFEETKEYSDSSCQHEPLLFSATHQTQTDPEPKVVRVSYSTQTEPPRLATFAAQTEPEPEPIQRVMVEMEVQTESPEEEEQPSGSLSPPEEQVESLASSSSTIIPPTPRARPQTLELHDEPPAYNQINPEEQEQERMAAVKRYHPGTKIPFEPIVGGISPEAIEEWKALKEELGIDCLVIDEIIERSQRNTAKSPKDGKRRSGRFYNIYNTYIYDKNSGPTSVATQALMWVAASALVLLAASPYMVPQYNVPGGPTYYDRAAWSSFNSIQPGGEGFSPDGSAAVWNFLGRVGGGAARIARGWPT
ncbi:hypothetical protein H0H87_011981 [Tephrocybe sp. NHM501043]|nr:hypothetical protein H0H87_011981 [Tephrocybe sp. NHM501043]